MPRENAEAKGRRYLLEGRLVLIRVSPYEITARCRGNGDAYELGWTPEIGWYCDCPARIRCAHLVGLQLVTLPESARRTLGVPA